MSTCPGCGFVDSGHAYACPERGKGSVSDDFCWCGDGPCDNCRRHIEAETVACIVAWLRKEAAKRAGAWAVVLKWAAGRIEAGEWKKEGP